MAARTCRAAATALVLAAAVACGHKGDPQPPDRPMPPPVAAFSIERVGPAVTLRVEVPDPAREDRAPRVFERVDVYALTKPAAEGGPLPLELGAAAHRIASVNAPPKATDGQPAGDKSAVATLAFTDTLAAGSTDTTAVRYYVVQAVNGKRRGPWSAILKVPLGPNLSAPANVVANYDERTLTLSWAPGAAQRFVVEETDADGSHARRVTTAPLEAPKFEDPVVFGKARCFAVRAIQSGAGVTLVGEPAAPICVTPADHFPPPAPADLVALAGDAGVELSWSASAAADLAGYIVLRAEGANGTLQPLTPAPIMATAYQDATARAGVTYQYAVKAVDGAANESALSNRYTVTARGKGRDVARVRRHDMKGESG